MKKSFFIVLTIVGLWLSVSVSAQTKPQTDQAKSKSAGAENTGAKAAAPRVVQIDLIGLKNLLKPNGKPLLINFWATWCEPCREEFPDLVKISADYKGKIDVVTVSLDFLSEIERDVPKFLAEMKAEMPAYLLKTDNEDEAARLVSGKWQGALPFTIIFDAAGKETYSRQGKFKTEILRAEIDKLLAPKVE
jgi:thiol-disulfide isomerase/thioredoxin